MKKILLFLLLAPYSAFCASAAPVKQLSNEVYACAFYGCGKEFTKTGANFEAHMLQHINVLPECPKCFTSMANVQGVSYHLHFCSKKSSPHKEITTMCPFCKTSIDYYDAYNHIYISEHRKEDFQALAKTSKKNALTAVPLYKRHKPLPTPTAPVDEPQPPAAPQTQDPVLAQLLTLKPLSREELALITEEHLDFF